MWKAYLIIYMHGWSFHLPHKTNLHCNSLNRLNPCITTIILWGKTMSIWLLLSMQQYSFYLIRNVVHIRGLGSKWLFLGLERERKKKTCSWLAFHITSKKDWRNMEQDIRLALENSNSNSKIILNLFWFKYMIWLIKII